MKSISKQFKESVERKLEVKNFTATKTQEEVTKKIVESIDLEGFIKETFLSIATNEIERLKKLKVKNMIEDVNSNLSPTGEEGRFIRHNNAFVERQIEHWTSEREIIEGKSQASRDYGEY